jgi:hypothetical protein
LEYINTQLHEAEESWKPMPGHAQLDAWLTHKSTNNEFDWWLQWNRVSPAQQVPTQGEPHGAADNNVGDDTEVGLICQPLLMIVVVR